MQPIGENVLVKPFFISGQTEGGLFIPESLERPSNKGIVVAVGNGTKKNKMKFTPDQICYRMKDYGLELEINGEKHFLMNQDALIATE